MKSRIKYISFILILITPYYCFSQWTDITLDTTDYYNVIKFKNQNEGLIMGDSGIILKTIDGGYTWERVIYSANVNFYDFQYINDTLIYAYGSGKIIKSENAGDTWIISFDLPTSKGYFNNKNLGFAVGSNGIYKSTNEGMNWTSVWNYSEGDYGFGSIKDIKFLNDSIGFACGTKHISGGGIFGIILKTTDGGDNWLIVYEDSPWGYTIKEIDVVVDTIIYFLTDANNLLKTIDFGNTWEKIKINIDINTSDEINSMFFKNTDTIYAVANTSLTIPENCIRKRKIFRTTDGGQTWITQYLEGNNICQDIKLTFISFSNDTTGFAVGYEKILKTTNSGGDTNILDTIIYYSINTIGGEANLNFNIHPNPSNNIISIEIINVYRKKIRLEIWNVIGKIVFINDLDGNHNIKSQKVDVSTFEKGIYFVRLTSNTTSMIKKMVIY